MPSVLPHEPGCPVFAGFDPAFQRDACAGVIVRVRGALIEVCELFERKPKKGKPLVPSDTVKEFAAIAKRHGARGVISDIHYRESVKEHLREAGLQFVSAPGGNPGKARVYEHTRELLHGGRVRWSSRHRRLTEQLKSIVAKPLAGGLIQINSPRRRGAHGDIASAFTLALWAAVKKRNRMVEALKTMSEREKEKTVWHKPGELESKLPGWNHQADH